MIKNKHTISVDSPQKVSCNDFILQLTEKQVPFALYRDKHHSKHQLLIDPSPVSFQSLSFEDHAGFVIHPFEPHKKGKIITPRYQYTLNDLQELIQVPKFEKPANLFTVSIQNDTLRDEYIQNVKKAIGYIASGEVKKIVVSRVKNVKHCKKDIVQNYLRACDKYTDAFVSLHYTQENGLWLGATPETLLKIENNTFETMALAGTQINRHDSIKEASWKQKEIEEQALVSRFIINCFKKIRLREYEEDGPRTLAAGHLLHLCTIFSVDLLATNYPNLGTSMLPLLHPTSAVCGLPKEPSLNFVTTNELHNRKLFSGYIGPLNMENKTNLYVNLRCAELINDSAILYAGAGITEDSDPVKEWVETDEKCLVLSSIFE